MTLLKLRDREGEGGREAGRERDIMFLNVSIYYEFTKNTDAMR